MFCFIASLSVRFLKDLDTFVVINGGLLSTMGYHFFRELSIIRTVIWISLECCLEQRQSS